MTQKPEEEGQNSNLEIEKRQPNTDADLPLRAAVALLSRIRELDPETISDADSLAQTSNGFIDASSIVVDEIVLSNSNPESQKGSPYQTRYWVEDDTKAELSVAYKEPRALFDRERQTPGSFNLSLTHGHKHVFSFFLKRVSYSDENPHFSVASSTYKENGDLGDEVFYYPDMEESAPDLLGDPHYYQNMAVTIQFMGIS